MEKYSFFSQLSSILEEINGIRDWWMIDELTMEQFVKLIMQSNLTFNDLIKRNTRQLPKLFFQDGNTTQLIEITFQEKSEKQKKKQ